MLHESTSLKQYQLLCQCHQVVKDLYTTNYHDYRLSKNEISLHITLRIGSNFRIKGGVILEPIFEIKYELL